MNKKRALLSTEFLHILNMKKLWLFRWIFLCMCSTSFCEEYMDFSIVNLGVETPNYFSLNYIKSFNTFGRSNFGSGFNIKSGITESSVGVNISKRSNIQVLTTEFNIGYIYNDMWIDQSKKVSFSAVTNYSIPTNHGGVGLSVGCIYTNRYFLKFGVFSSFGKLSDY